MESLRYSIAPVLRVEETAKGKYYREVIEGLSSPTRTLPAMYACDQEALPLIEQLLHAPEYYLTASEREIFTHQIDVLTRAITSAGGSFDLIELGAHDAVKSSLLLKHLLEQGQDFTYIPVGIAGEVPEIHAERVLDAVPTVHIVPRAGEYFEVLEEVHTRSTRRKVVLYLGNLIGRMDMEEGYRYCRAIKENLSSGDIFIMGFDLKKNPQVILDAYSGGEDAVAAMSSHVLARINQDLQADFDNTKFSVYQNYDPISGVHSRYIVSLSDQTITIGYEQFTLREHDHICIGRVQKFSREDIDHLAQRAGFEVLGDVSDQKDWFVDSIWMVR